MATQRRVTMRQAEALESMEGRLDAMQAAVESLTEAVGRLAAEVAGMAKTAEEIKDRPADAVKAVETKARHAGKAKES